MHDAVNKVNDDAPLLGTERLSFLCSSNKQTLPKYGHHHVVDAIMRASPHHIRQYALLAILPLAHSSPANMSDTVMVIIVWRNK
jgi:hypothetical protein